MVGGGGGRGVDPTWGFDKIGDLSDIDLKKQVRKNKAQPGDEGIIEGVTHDSISGFVEASKAAKHAPKNPSSFGDRVRRLLGR